MAEETAQPGRHCPLSYRSRASDLAHLTPLHTASCYLVGGLYGNLEALDAIEALAAHEARLHHTPPRLIFNGDFHWFDAETAWFVELQRRVSAHRTMLGNVEAELVSPQPGVGCGCAYPATTAEQTVQWSNAIMARLQQTAQGCTDELAWLASLPRQYRVQVGSCRIGVVHGDPDSLAGWGLDLDSMPAIGEIHPQLATWFRDAEVDLLASSHTCRAFAQSFPGVGAVFNNGAAGMPNFSADSRILITRVAQRPLSLPEGHQRIYAIELAGACVEAILLPWDRAGFLRRFDQVWPTGSAAAQSYRRRITDGPAHHQDQAKRLIGR